MSRVIDNKVCILIQGPIHDSHHAFLISRQITKIFKNLNPHKVILQSHSSDFFSSINYKNKNFNLVKIKDPGSNVVEPIRKVQFNLDRQLSTSSSLQIVKSKINIVIKIRSDLFINFFGFLAIKIILRNWILFKNKIFVVPITTTDPLDVRYPLFQVCDWFYIIDSKRYTSVFNFYSFRDRIEQKINPKSGKNLLYGAENFICLKLLRASGEKIKPKGMWDNSLRHKWNLLFKKYFIVLPYLGFFRSIKYKRIYQNLYHSYGFGLGFDFYLKLIKALRKC
jgi:hypothetical protein